MEILKSISRFIFISVFVVVISSTNILSQSFNATGLPVTAADATAGGCGNAIASPNTTTTCIAIPVSGVSASSRLSNLSVSFTVGIDPATWIGDYGITLRAPGGSPSLLLMGQPGNATPFASGCGDSTNINSGTTVTFADSPTAAVNNLPSVVAGLSSTATLPSGIYNPSNGTTSPSGSLGTTFAGLDGTAQNGSWQMCFHDVSQTDTISIGGANISLTQQAPTAANVQISGRVKSQFGRGLANARVNLVNTQSGEISQTRTNSLGYFAIGNLNSGNSYLLEISRKGYTFGAQLLTLENSLENLEFIGY